MLTLVPEITKEFILSKVTEKEIFDRYIGEVSYGELFCSPLRNDKNPTCSLKLFDNGRVFMKDFSGHFWGDCFAFLMVSENKTFMEVCKLIVSDFGLIKSYKVSSKKRKKSLETMPITETSLEVKYKKFTSWDISFWGDSGVSTHALKKFIIYPIEYLWINGELNYTYKESDPAYCYHFGDKKKIYFPLRKTYRFLTNFKGLQGEEQLPQYGNLLIVTKSYKDVAAMAEDKFFAIAPQAESIALTKEEYERFKKRFKRIVIIFDFDLAGIRTANKMRKDLGVEVKFFTNGRLGTHKCLAKDYTDMNKKKKGEGKRELNNLLLSPTWRIV